MEKRIVYNDYGQLCVVVPSPNFKGSIEELAKKDVPENLEYTIVDLKNQPASRNWRNAWQLENGKISVNLEKAKLCHKHLMLIKCADRAGIDLRNKEGLDALKQKIDALNFDNIDNFQALYDTWLPEFEQRKTKRQYKMYEV